MEEKNTSTSYLDQKPLVFKELSQAKELLKQLESNLHAAATSTTAKLLLPKILSSFENTLSNYGIRDGCNYPFDSPPSVDGSPRSDYKSDLIGSPSKKRKTLPKWTEQVPVCEHTGLEGPLDDGYSWRKYEQKDILGATYPRGYYRCTHSNAQGCIARKQVQRSDEDPSMFSVTYRGRHTCIQAAHLLPGQSQNRHCQEHQKPIKSQETIINFQTGCHGTTYDSNTTKPVLRSPSFSFPSPSISPFSSSLSISESNSFSPYQVNNFNGGQNIETSDYGLCEFTSTLDSQDLYLDFDFLDGSLIF
ncbi:hypothetical protein MKX01_006893 [Papaver californicum]|nr:hypothetical protein MKX01_006893 [Papaver californicum]